jgi:hypothetical protein
MNSLFRKLYLKQCIDEWSDRAALDKNDEHAEKEKQKHDREEPIALAHFQEFPEFADEG